MNPGRAVWAAAALLLAGSLVACGGSSPAPTAAPSSPADDTGLRIGAVFSKTGDLAIFALPQVAAVQLAVDDINKAGGVNGQPVHLQVEDDATDEQVASSEVQRLIEQRVSAIIGPASSRNTLAVIDAIVSAGVVECSGSATTPELTTYPDNGLFFRTAPSDVAQGKTLADLVLRDGHKTANVAAINDAYGQGLAESFTSAFEADGGKVLHEVAYDAKGTDFSADAQAALEDSPQALVLLGLPETGSKMLASWVEAGKGPSVIPTYAGEGMSTDTLPDLVSPDDPQVVDGLTGTSIPGPSNAFIKRLRHSLQDVKFAYASNAYDCAVLIALAATEGHSNESAAIAAAMLPVANSGKPCRSYAKCAKLLDQGENIDYVGESGPVDLTEAGEPDAGTYEQWTFVDGKLVTKGVKGSRK